MNVLNLQNILLFLIVLGVGVCADRLSRIAADLNDIQDRVRRRFPTDDEIDREIER